MNHRPHPFPRAHSRPEPEFPPSPRWLPGRPWWLLLLGLSTAILLEEPLRRTRQRGLPDAEAYSAHQPVWLQHVMVGLGGFRGVIAEVLWLRAAHMQEQGRYFDQVQLAEWITALDPRAIDAWVFHAWNLAYNISSMMPRLEDRVGWVVEGIALLRDRALPINPKNARLHRELGWLYQDKVGSGTDPAHGYYKLSLAASLADSLTPQGGAPPPGSNQAALLAQHFALDAVTMKAIEARFGTLDWRLPYSHAIYWAWRGIPHAATSFDLHSCRRMVQQNLVESIRHGKFSGQVAEGRYATRPRPELIDPTLEFFKESLSLSEEHRRPFAFFLHFVIRHHLSEGDHAEAEKCYRLLRDLAGQRHHIPTLEQIRGGQSPGPDFFGVH